MRTYSGKQKPDSRSPHVQLTLDQWAMEEHRSSNGALPSNNSVASKFKLFKALLSTERQKTVVTRFVVKCSKRWLILNECVKEHGVDTLIGQTNRATGTLTKVKK